MSATYVFNAILPFVHQSSVLIGLILDLPWLGLRKSSLDSTVSTDCLEVRTGEAWLLGNRADTTAELSSWV